MRERKPYIIGKKENRREKKCWQFCGTTIAFMNLKF